MKYQFPVINHIDDVLPHIEGSEEFIVARREYYTIINYLMMGENTFPTVNVSGGSPKMRAQRSLSNAIRRECRGLIFDLDGKPLARRLQKFFNVNERPETHLSQIDLSQPHTILEKLDGSMVSPIMIKNRFRWGTKMGITDTSMAAEVIVARNPQYAGLAHDLHNGGWHPIFEYCSRQHRIVVDYPQPMLVLLAIRNLITGEYKSYQSLVNFGKTYDIPVVRAYPGTVESMEALVASIRNENEGEGWIIRFDDGHMIKIKNDTYVRLHRTKDRIRFERNLVDVIIHEELDDLKGFMTEIDLVRVNQYETDFWRQIIQVSHKIEDQFQKFFSKSRGDRKTFAMLISNEDPISKMFLFQRFDGKSARDGVTSYIEKHISNNKRFDEKVKPLIVDCMWKVAEE